MPIAPFAEVNLPLKPIPVPREAWETAEFPADAWRNDVNKLPASGVPDRQRVPVEFVSQLSVPLYVSADQGKGFPANVVGPVEVHTYQIDGKTLEVVLPSSPASGAQLPSADEVAAAVASLPPDARAGITRVEFSPRDEGAPAYVTNENAPGTVFISAYDRPVTQRDLDTILLHETAHIVDQPDAGDWRAAVESDGEFATPYARNSFNGDGNPVNEDFAETYQIYHLVKNTPDEAAMRELYPARFALLDQMQAPQTQAPWLPFGGDPGIYANPTTPGNPDPGIYAQPPGGSGTQAV